MLIPITFKADAGSSSKKGKIRAEDISALFAFCLPGQKTGILDTLNKCEAYNATVSNGEASFYLHSGYVSICGHLIYIEEDTNVHITLPASGTVRGSFGIKVDLSQIVDAEVVFYAQESGSLTQNDLNENPTTGVYMFELYKYDATPTTFSLSTKTTEVISRLKETAVYAMSRTGDVSLTYTIEERLAALEAKTANL